MFNLNYWICTFFIGAGIFCSPNVPSQTTVPLPSLFKFSFAHYPDGTYLELVTDSMVGNPELDPSCSALYYFHDYLFSNFAKAYNVSNTLGSYLPDTLMIQKEFNTYLKNDTAFQRLYLRSIDREMVEPISIDSMMQILARFYYDHPAGNNAVMHICIGINRVLEMKNTVSHIYHAAFGYMVVRSLDESNDPSDRVTPNTDNN